MFFLQNDFIDGIECECEQQGVLWFLIMQWMFSFLCLNDLIYVFVIKSYMMGEVFVIFDLLFWNGDGFGLSGKMVVEYLWGLCQCNEFVGEGFDFFGEKFLIKDVIILIMLIICEIDYIVVWKDCYCGY